MQLDINLWNVLRQIEKKKPTPAVLQNINWETLLPDGDKDKVSLQRVGGECKLLWPPRYFMRLFIDNVQSPACCSVHPILPSPSLTLSLAHLPKFNGLKLLVVAVKW